MSIESILNIAISILTGLAICIPLIRAVVKAVSDCAASKDWGEVVAAVAKYMAQAETSIETGATRKEWVLGMIRTTASTFSYPLTESDYEKIGKLIDTLCDMTKVVNSDTALVEKTETE